MSPTADSRYAILRRSKDEGELDPGIAAVLTRYEPGWDQNPAHVRWWETYSDYAQWAQEHGRPPEEFDDGAAGLKVWMRSQDESRLTRKQRERLQVLPGWRGTTSDPTAAAVWGLVFGLSERGCSPRRREERIALVEQIVEVRQNFEDTPEFADARCIAPRVPDEFARQLFAYALFVARNNRQPAASEPSGRWIRTVRRKSTCPELLAALSIVPDWQALEDEPLEFTLSAKAYNAWCDQHGRRPSRRSSNPVERRSARWFERSKSDMRAGRLPAAAAKHVRRLLRETNA